MTSDRINDMSSTAGCGYIQGIEPGYGKDKNHDDASCASASTLM